DALKTELIPWKIYIADKQGKPIEGATVSISGLRPAKPPWGHWQWPRDSAGPAPRVQTNSSGIATLHYPKHLGSEPQLQDVGKVSVTVSHPRYVAMGQDFPVKTNASVVLEPGYPMTLSAKDAVTGEPIEKFGAFSEDSYACATWSLKDGRLTTTSMSGEGETTMLATLDDGQPRRF
ncbi:unnamed protein product, partial [Hapterophycus canaliculatus]